MSGANPVISAIVATATGSTGDTGASSCVQFCGVPHCQTCRGCGYAAGHAIDFFPKFHCELNYIEMIWAYAKKFLRRRCTYNFNNLRLLKVPCCVPPARAATLLHVHARVPAGPARTAAGLHHEEV